MLIPVPTVYRRRSRGDKRRPVLPPVSPGPRLVEAVYESMTSVTLTFDVPVVVTTEWLANVAVVDDTQGEAYHGENYEILSPTSVRVILYFTESIGDEGITLTVSPPTGIVRASDGTAWAGVSGVALPFSG